MKNSIIFILLIILFGCTNPSIECTKVDEIMAEEVIIDYFGAISDKKFDDLKILSTQEYVLYEDGAIWNNDSLINLVKSMPQAQIKYELKDFNVKPDCNGAFLSYLNHGIVTLNDTTQIDYHWIESAYVKKVDGTLKLDFLHSTVAK
jgi:hypothetical protein